MADGTGLWRLSTRRSRTSHPLMRMAINYQLATVPRREVHRSIYFESGKDKRFLLRSHNGIHRIIIKKKRIRKRKKWRCYLSNSFAEIRSSLSSCKPPASYACSPVSEYAYAIYARYTRIFHTGKEETCTRVYIYA